MSATEKHPGRADRPRLFRVILLAWLVIAIAIVLVGLPIAGTARFSSTAQVMGTVLGKEPANHAIVRARYEVAGRAYEVADSFVGSPNPGFDELNIGDAVIVFYDPAEPSRAVLSDPERRARNDLGFLLLVIVIFPTLFAALLFVSLSFVAPLTRMLSRAVSS